MHDIFAKNMQKQYMRPLVMFIGMAIFFGGLWLTRLDKSEETPEGMRVVATFFPLADFAGSIGGAGIDVHQITPDGVEAHEYEPSPQDVAAFLSADVALINGGGVDVWAEALIPEAEAQGVTVLRMSDVVSFIGKTEEFADDHADDNYEEEGDDNHAYEGSIDPHAWLDPIRAQEMARAIGDAFAQEDPENAEMYIENSQKLEANIAVLDRDFIATLASCESRAIFVAHDAFSYWALRYNVEVHAVSGVAPESEPSVQKLASLIREAKELQVTTIFFESPASTALAETIASEIGATVDVLSPLEGRTPEQVAAGATYLTLMRENLHALSKALSCQE